MFGPGASTERSTVCASGVPYSTCRACHVQIFCFGYKARVSRRAEDMIAPRESSVPCDLSRFTSVTS